MNTVKLLIILILVGLYSEFAHSIGADRELNTALITAKQITTPSNPASGFSSIYVKSDGKAYILASDGTEKPLGSGAGGNILNLLEDGSFEDGVVEATCSSCTASQQTTGAIITPFNTSFLRAAFSASTGNVIVCGNSSNVDGVQGKVSGWIKTDQSDVVVYPRIDSVDISSLSKPVSSDGEWRYYEIPVPMGATNACLKVEATSSITGNVDIDDVFVGAAKVAAELGIQTGWEDCGLTTSDFTGFGTVTNIEDQCRRDGPDLLMQVKFTSGVATAIEARVNLKFKGSALTSSSGISGLEVAGFWATSNAFPGQSFILKSASIGYHTFGYHTAAVAGLINRNGNDFSSTGTAISYSARIPIAEWSATTDIYSSSAEGSNVRLDTANGYGSTNTAIRNLTNSTLRGGTNITCSNSATNGASCVSGGYSIVFVQYCDNFSGAARFGVSKNSASLTTIFNDIAIGEKVAQASTSAADRPQCATGFDFASPGDIYRPHADTASTGTPNAATFTVMSVSDMLIGLFKDVVTSPGSSNGKPVLCSADISSTGVISNQDGGCFASCTNATTPVCTFETDYWAVKPKCWHTVQGNIQGGAASTLTDFSGSQLNGSFVPVSGDRTYFCHGVRN
jgi:hypothetical protein